MQTPQPTKNYSHVLAGTFNALCGLFWTTAYVLYVFQARSDSSYGMPVVALIMNLAWEFVHTFIIQYMELGVSFTSLGYWWTGVWQLPHLQLSYWVHSLLLFETLRYGPRQWHVVPLVADNFAPLVVSGLVLGISGQWAFTSQFSTSNSCFWSAYVCQNVSHFPIV